MRVLSAALGISIAIAGIFFSVAYLIFANLLSFEPIVAGHLAESFGAIPILGCPHTAEMLEQQRAKTRP
jgi:hypothetical protein